MLHGMDKSNIKTHDFKGLDDFFPAFVGGEQVDSNGTKKVWTDDELDQIVSNTKKLIDKNIFSGAPMVVGHPKTDAPAYGWVQDLKRDGKVLSVKGDKLHDEFAQGVEKGLWPNRSIRIGKGADGFYLKHIGFLGAVPPAIEGMDSIYNAATDDECFDYSSDSYTPNVLGRMMRRIREFIINKFDVETADSVMPDYEIESLSDHANSLRDEDSDTPTSYSKPEPKKTGAEPMTEFSQEQMDAAVEKAAKKAKEDAEAEFSKKEDNHKNELTAERNKRLAVEFSKNITALVDEGKLLPAQAEGMAEFMLQLSDADEANFEFSAGEEGKEEKLKKSPLKWFNDFTAALGKQIDFKESDAGDDDGPNGSSDFSVQGADVNADRLELHNKASEYMDSHEGVDYVTAVKAVEKQNS